MSSLPPTLLSIGFQKVSRQTWVWLTVVAYLHLFFLLFSPLLSFLFSFASFLFYKSSWLSLFSYANEVLGLGGLEGTIQVEHSIIYWFLSQPHFPASPSPMPLTSLSSLSSPHWPWLWGHPSGTEPHTSGFKIFTSMQISSGLEGSRLLMVKSLVSGATTSQVSLQFGGHWCVARLQMPAFQFPRLPHVIVFSQAFFKKLA